MRKVRAKSVFVATDHDPMLEDLKLKLKGLEVLMTLTPRVKPRG